MTNIQADTAVIETDSAIFPVSTRPLPAGLAEAGFDGDIAFSPAFDERKVGNGIGSLVLAFWLRGPGGAVKWKLHTGCYLRRTQTEWLDRFRGSANKPTAGMVDWHSPVPMKENDEPRYDCRLLGPGNACYGDGGYLLGDEAYEALVTGGEAALWLFLREMYRSRFEPQKWEEEARQGETSNAGRNKQ